MVTGVFAPPPQNVRCLPYSRLSITGSIPLADSCTGFNTCTPASIRSGISEAIAPQLCKNTLQAGKLSCT